jgi:hypothetical protein
MKWRFSVLAGGVEGSKLCLFSVIMPGKCVSNVSPRFHYRRLAFCFFPLATILESLSGQHLKAILNAYVSLPPTLSRNALVITPLLLPGKKPSSSLHSINYSSSPIFP